ncbi:MAG TPA: DUF5908 family protein [Ideonella sp.]|uniref:DUF5908 family protein n=1 Tax=Ideonella sp. TaxID=1929293 RepID=UPI002E2FEF70|nr:DUF5908 family protein [Ideonella sp.]HEX5685274.1 DUF5908 family protein [Ideonella sp.]
MSLEVRQLVLRASVQDEPDDDEDDDEEAGAAAKKATSCGGGEEDPCEDKEALKEEILAACRALLREELRALRER